MIENIKKDKISILFVQIFPFWGEGSSKKMIAKRGEHMKKIGKVKGCHVFLNGASQIPPASPPPS